MHDQIKSDVTDNFACKVIYRLYAFQVFSKMTSIPAAEKGIAKTLQKLKASVEAGNYYEAHQMYRTVANRYMKQDKHAAVVELTFSGALSLLQHGQSGSGSDLALYMLEAYQQGKVAVTTESLDRVVDLLDHYPPEEPGRKPFIARAVRHVKPDAFYL